jgi:putative Mg2+ transporter-C (MgtC) family protein
MSQTTMRPYGVASGAMEPFASGDLHEILIRLATAVVAGGSVGLNREANGKAAGLRTHILVALGAALFVMVPLSGPGAITDPAARVVQGVAAGVGFLGAGDIIQRGGGGRPVIRGLTSAAGIWVTAALGLMAGSGLTLVTVVGGSLALLVLIGLKPLENRVHGGEENRATEGATKEEAASEEPR